MSEEDIEAAFADMDEPEDDKGKKKEKVKRKDKKLTDAQKEKKKKNVFFRAKKKMTESALTSKGGKAAMKKFMDKETMELISIIKKIVAVETGDPANAEALEENATKIIIKSYSLYQGKIVDLEDFSKKTDEPLRQALRLLLKVYDNLHKLPEKIQRKTLEEKFLVLGVLFGNVQEGLKEILTPHLHEGSIARIDETFSIIARAEFFHNVWKNEKLDKEVKFCTDQLRELSLDKKKKTK